MSQETQKDLISGDHDHENHRLTRGKDRLPDHTLSDDGECSQKDTEADRQSQSNAISRSESENDSLREDNEDHRQFSPRLKSGEHLHQAADHEHTRIKLSPGNGHGEDSHQWEKFQPETLLSGAHPLPVHLFVSRNVGQQQDLVPSLQHPYANQMSTIQNLDANGGYDPNPLNTAEPFLLLDPLILPRNEPQLMRSPQVPPIFRFKRSQIMLCLESLLWLLSKLMMRTSSMNTQNLHQICLQLQDQEYLQEVLRRLRAPV